MQKYKYTRQILVYGHKFGFKVDETVAKQTETYPELFPAALQLEAQQRRTVTCQPVTVR